MSKKRTKLQKMKAQYHYALPSQHSFSGIEAVAQKTQHTDVTSLYYYDPRYITLDLRKTVLASLIIIVIQMVVYFGLK